MLSNPTAQRPRTPVAAAPDPKDQRITVRVSSAQRDLLNEASRAEDTTLSEFILDAATSRAEDVLADRRFFTLANQDYGAFLALLDSPVENRPRLRRLLAEPSVFES
jgi:uncharacterized protein (DUF1778 family)